MIVAVDHRFGELSIFGSAEEYRQVADLIRGGAGSVALDAEADVSPFDEPLARFVVRRTEDATVVFAHERSASVILNDP